ncbi:peptidoglycan editing factor PgeF [Sinanaerobacter chloroacetimidivorans]|uniref:Purine nucleoside phosphorylase n=1 Tax=Sinanaerobacter chloroacetimidivorans TaxID=2818044 RepID=A0A8J8B3J8_9FIRM|nr:peptidoglycan editing factor PgeF [Sinanaerobacter chloroacetimidivorans]MBR0599861.1 peptidoglycan editing factor PgeF [Sinanaerobacter chloroacetimidivorans]
MKIKVYFENDKYIAGITLRDESEPEDGNMALHACENPDRVIANRIKLAEMLNCGLDDFVCSYQTHSSNFHQVTQTDRGRGAKSMDTAIADNDALYTDEPNLLLCCFTADCVPVTFYNEISGLIGMIHSGWQGTVKEITSKVLEQIIQLEHCCPDDLKIHLGPALSQNRFEVDKDVCEKFEALGYAEDFIYYNDRTHKYHIDNQQVVKRQCERMGIRQERITVDETCTYDSPYGFSYRKDKNCGRHLSFIMKKR